MREKLIDLLLDTVAECMPTECLADIADHLIANDVVPVVRCKDCAFAHPCDALANYIECGQFYGMAMEKDWYCADGERKDNET